MIKPKRGKSVILNFDTYKAKLCNDYVIGESLKTSKTIDSLKNQGVI